MPIDTSIYNRLQPMQIEDPNKIRAEMAQLRAMQNQNKLFDMGVADKERAQARENQLMQATRSAFDPSTGKIDPNKYRQGLGQAGDYQGLQKFETDQAALSKEQRAAEKAQLESQLKKFEVAGQIMGGVKDQATWELARQQTAQVFGQEAAAQMPAQYDPALIEQKRMQAMGVKEQLEQKWKALDFDLNTKKFSYQQQNDAANRSVTLRGQNLTDARGREANDINRQLVGEKKQLEVEALKDKARERDLMKQTSVAKAQGSIDLIKKALSHPGLESATGVQGKVDPRNYVPGTDATNFQVLLDQLGGQAFLQAFESLKGGGQITEVEGKKATEAMARLNRKQSTAEFKRSLGDLLEVYEAGLARVGGAPSAKAAPAGPNIDDLLKKYGG